MTVKPYGCEVSIGNDGNIEYSALIEVVDKTFADVRTKWFINGQLAAQVDVYDAQTASYPTVSNNEVWETNETLNYGSVEEVRAEFGNGTHDVTVEMSEI